MSPRSSAVAVVVLALGVVSTARADDEPPIGPTGPPPPAPTIAPAPAPPVTPAPSSEPEVVGPPRPPPDAPLPAEPAEASDTVTPRPIEAPIEPEPELVPPRFGSPGTVVLMSEFGLGLGFTGYSSTSQAKRFGASFSPSFEVFVVRNLSVGASLYASHGESRGYLSDGSLIEESSTSFGAAPRLGYAIPLDRWVTLYPRIAFGVVHVDAQNRLVSGRVALTYADGFDQTSAEKTSPYVYAIAPLLIHPSSNFFVGAGPSIYHELGSGSPSPISTDPRTVVSLETVVGGYFGGAPVPPERAGYPLTSSKAPKRYRFGERNDVLLSGDFYLGASTFSYRESKSTSNGVSISPAFDYFVADHVSVGLGVGFDHSKVTNRAGTGNRAFSSSTGGHVHVRAGVQASLAERLSLYPRAYLQVNYADISAEAASREETSLRIALDAPFVFHAAPHFFIGCGPFVTHDVARYINGTSNDVRGTSAGMSSMLGGWL